MYNYQRKFFTDLLKVSPRYIYTSYRYCDDAFDDDFVMMVVVVVCIFLVINFFFWYFGYEKPWIFWISGWKNKIKIIRIYRIMFLFTYTGRWRSFELFFLLLFSICLIILLMDGVNFGLCILIIFIFRDLFGMHCNFYWNASFFWL